MKVYKLTPIFFKQLQMRVVGFGLLISLIVVPVGLLVGTRGVITWSAIAFIPIMIGAIFFGLFQSLRQQRKTWESYQLIFDGDTIRKIQNGYQDVLFSRNGISKIIEFPRRGITVQTNNAGLQITIPFTIESYEEIRDILEGWQTIEVQTKSKATLLIPPLLIVITVVALFATTILSTNTYVVMVLGIILIFSLIGSLIVTQTNSNVPTQTKRLMWFVILPIFSIACRIFAALTDVLR